jgi:histidine kinase
MEFIKSPARNIVNIQLTGWLIFFSIHLIYGFPTLGFIKALVESAITITFYAIIIYANGLWLIPAFYEKKAYATYALSLLGFFAGAVCLKMIVNHWVFGLYYQEAMYDFSLAQWAYVCFSTVLIVFTSFLCYATIRYFSLLQWRNESAAQHYQSELSLLKAQVQPHFLFNTLNNIYFQAHKESPDTARQIERLAQMMRFFLEESPMEKIQLMKEISFLENYIELEKARMRYPLQLSFQYTKTDALRIPPMLLIPFVENVFKHGINKRKTDNPISISLQVIQKRLIFEVENLNHSPTPDNTTGFGLKNLRKRLILLYKEDFILTAVPRENKFHAFLNIPIE